MHAFMHQQHPNMARLGCSISCCCHQWPVICHVQAAADLRSFKSDLVIEGARVHSSLLQNMNGQDDIQQTLAPLRIAAEISCCPLAQDVNLPAVDVKLELGPVKAGFTDELLGFLSLPSSQAASSASTDIFQDICQVQR